MNPARIWVRWLSSNEKALLRQCGKKCDNLLGRYHYSSSTLDSQLVINQSLSYLHSSLQQSMGVQTVRTLFFHYFKVQGTAGKIKSKNCVDFLRITSRRLRRTDLDGGWAPISEAKGHFEWLR